jgi:hypothetical protein
MNNKLLTQETPPSAFHLAPKATMRNGTQAPKKLRGKLDGIRRRWKVLVMVSVNNSGDRVVRSHWEESFRKHCRDNVYVCRRCRSSYVRSTSKGNNHGGMCPVISPWFQFILDEIRLD